MVGAVACRAAKYGHYKLFEDAAGYGCALQTSVRAADGLLPLDLAVTGNTQGHHRAACILTTNAPRLVTSAVRTTVSKAGDGEPAEASTCMSVATRNTLHLAVLGGHLPTIELVHAAVPSLCNERDMWGFTPLAIACAIGSLPIVKLLLGEEAATREAAQAAGRGRLVLGRWTLGPAPHTLAKTNAGLTPLMLAVRRAFLTLLQAWWCMTQPSISLNGLFQKQSRASAPDVVELLVSCGALPNPVNSAGDTALHVATTASVQSLAAGDTDRYLRAQQVRRCCAAYAGREAHARRSD